MHIELLVLVMATVGMGSTLITLLAEAEQPDAFVPVTVYVVLTVGETVIAFVVCPVPQRYDVPPVAVSVIDVPAQGVLFDAEMFIVGVVPMVIVFVAVFVQPAAFVPVTVYVVVAVGVTVILEPVCPVLHR
jgi:hypothetical protein